MSESFSPASKVSLSRIDQITLTREEATSLVRVLYHEWIPHSRDGEIVKNLLYRLNHFIGPIREDEL